MNVFTLRVLPFLCLIGGALASQHNNIAGYTPPSNVDDHLAIDLDQALFSNLLEREATNEALAVYSNGSHSKGYASITLEQTTGAIHANTPFTGTSIRGEQITLLSYKYYEAGTTQIRMRYLGSDCYVGGAPEPQLDGCLTAFGTIALAGISNAPSLPYTYEPLVDNKNGRTLRGFSTAAQAKMGECENCPYVDYRKYTDYYGSFDYGDEWVTAALEQRVTKFKQHNTDFSQFSSKAAGQAAVVGALNLNLWMYVVREFEDALDDCNKGCANEQCNTDKVNAWDEGVAFYTGSLEGPGGSGQGVLGYALADELCVDFNTCTAKSKSAINAALFEEFKKGLALLQNEECQKTRAVKDDIVGLMTVPLVQGTLRAVYDTTPSQVAKGQAAAFSAALNPLVHRCSAPDAMILADELTYSNTSNPNFASIKAALERNYKCLGITCDQVGGLWSQTTQSYRKGAAPCAIDSSGSQINGGIVALLAIGGVVFLVCLGVLLERYWRSVF